MLIHTHIRTYLCILAEFYFYTHVYAIYVAYIISMKHMVCRCVFAPYLKKQSVSQVPCGVSYLGSAGNRGEYCGIRGKRKCSFLCFVRRKRKSRSRRRKQQRRIRV